MLSPLISVVIPTYNRAAYLPQAVTSALGQVDVEVEVIVVDDGSTDGTVDLIERKAPDWGERFHYLRQQNAERSVARNNGLSHARGEFVAFLDSDDVWQPEHARACLDVLLANPNATAAFSEYGLIDATGRVISPMMKRPNSDGNRFRRDLCLKRLILHPTEVILRRSALKAELFDPEIPGAEDWLTWVQLAQNSLSAFERVGKATVWMRLHPEGTFGNPQKFTRNLLLTAQKVIDTGLPAELGISAERIMAINRTHCAYAHYLSGNMSEARRLFISALRTYPKVLTEIPTWRVMGRLIAGDRISRLVRERIHRGHGDVVG